MKKRIIILTMTLILCLCILPGTVFALDPLGSENNPWNIGLTNSSDVTAWINEDKELTISGSGATKDFGYYNLPPWVDYITLKSDITAVVVNEGVTVIGTNAFCSSQNLTSAALPDSLTSLGDNAFAGDSALSCITIPSNVTNIGKSCFKGCSALQDIYVEWIRAEDLPALGSDAFKDIADGATLHVPGGTEAIYTAAEGWDDFYVQETHHLVLVSGQPAAYKVDGWKDYYECKDSAVACHKYYEDAEGLIEITDLDAWKAEGGKGYIQCKGPKLDVLNYDTGELAAEGPDTFEFKDDGIHIYSDDLVLSGETDEKIIMDGDGYWFEAKNLTVHNSFIGQEGVFGYSIITLRDSVIDGDILIEKIDEYLVGDVYFDGSCAVKGQLVSDSSLYIHGSTGSEFRIKEAHSKQGLTFGMTYIENGKENYVGGYCLDLTPEDVSKPIFFRAQDNVIWPGEDEYQINNGQPYIVGEEYEINLPIVRDKKGNIIDPQPGMKLFYFEDTDDGLNELDAKPEKAGHYFVMIGIDQNDPYYYGTGYYEYGIEDRTYRITEGIDAKIDLSNIKDVLFVSNADFSLFKEVLVDSKVVDSKYYMAESGSTEVTLKSEFLKTLSPGEHTLTIASEDGEASTTFVVLAAKDPAPNTGDSTNSALWSTIMIVSGLLLLAAAIYIKKGKAEQ